MSLQNDNEELDMISKPLSSLQKKTPEQWNDSFANRVPGNLFTDIQTPNNYL